MKMKYVTAVLLFIAMYSSAQQVSERPGAQITFHVTKDDGKPVQGATVIVSTFHHADPGETFGPGVSASATGITDENGTATVSIQSLTGEIRYHVKDQAGFYRDEGNDYRFKDEKENKWQPWNPAIDIVFKPVIKPVPMYARKMGETVPLTIPAVAKPVGFDLIVGDWVAPYGKGNISDLVFTFTESIPLVDIRKPFDVTLSISFSNKGDGIQSVFVPINVGSLLRLPRYAPENGYVPALVRQTGRPTEDKPINSSNREDQNYFVRVRTIMDERGNIKSALYGKIDGDIEFWGNHRIRFNYYLNPNANDRNMEFDPKKNLFSNLPYLDQITRP